jgi:threonylcarbamoyladenosine tRNA methylthiotransferase MtaB
MKVALLTLGCRVNQSESSVIEGTLKENGITIVNLSDNPDFCIINTCTVTSKSDYQSRQLIRRAARTGAKVLVTGCYSELKSEEATSIPGVFKLIENRRKYEITDIVMGTKIDPFYGNCSRSRPYLKVQDGCNFKCAYCSVPLARGKSRSIPVEDAVRTAHFIAEQGYNEIVLTGIHLGTYGFDLKEKSNLNDLIKKILLETKIHRLRLSSLEINEINDEFIELLQEDRICRHLHLPLQSGSNKILNLMKRRYSAQQFSKKIMMIFRKVENISLGSDIIAGFPGEGEEEFLKTYTLLRELPFSYLHIFPFSPRPYTEAAEMTTKPSRDVVRKRMEKLLELNRIIRARYMSSQVSRILEVIVEEKINEGTVAGTSSNYLKISALSDIYIRGSLVFVRPTSIVDGALRGSVIR